LHLEGELAGNRPMDRCSKTLIRRSSSRFLFLGFRHRIGGTLPGDDGSLVFWTQIAASANVTAFSPVSSKKSRDPATPNDRLWS
jgi:hypothetical protein